MKRILLASTILIATPALAGPWTVGQQTFSYSTSHPLGTINTAPAYGYEEADVASNFTETTWTHDTGDTPGPGGQFSPPGSGSEAKFRADCNIAFENSNDPIIFPGIAGGSPHKHSFFGNLDAATNTQNVTYASLRASGNSTCYGGPLNRTLYWEPSLQKVLPSGVTATIKPANIVTYYESGDMSAIGTGAINDPNVVTRWPRGINMVFGFNMADPNDNTKPTSSGVLVAAANAVSPGRYTAAPKSAGGFVGWTCNGVNGSNADSPIPGSGYQPYLRNANGTATLTCAPGTQLIAELVSYPCWDRVNLTSPDGRGHFTPFIRDNNTGGNVCPDGTSRVQQFRSKVTFNNFFGSSDYKEWFWSSDRMAGMTQFLNGQTGHADLIPAWAYGTAASPSVFINFSVHCGGQTIVMSGTTLTGDAHECGTGRFTSSSQLWANEASPDGSQPNPLVNLSPDQTGPLRYFPLPAGTTGDWTFTHPN
jgi:hypothetical protein